LNHLLARTFALSR